MGRIAGIVVQCTRVTWDGCVWCGGKVRLAGKHTLNSDPLWSAVVRLSILGVGIVVALIPTLHAAHLTKSVPLLPFKFYEIARATNELGLFRDFFYIIIVTSIVSFGDFAVHLFRGFGPSPVWVKAFSTILTLYYAYILIYGTMRFAELAQTHGPDDDIGWDIGVILFSFAMSALTEIVVAVTETRV